MANAEDQKTDIRLGGGNGFYTIQVLTDAARAWFAENVQTEGWQWLGDTLGIDDIRTFDAIQFGAAEAGLEVA